MQENPVALVTGANKGIGLQIAKDLAAQGFTLLLGSRNLEAGESAAKTLEATRAPFSLTSPTKLQSLPRQNASAANSAVSMCS
jgi:NAD(P)-dependent dehydrogenase (short-subunit alcohol dehydrogenase family)